MARAAALLGDRWTLLVIREAFYGVTRFEDIRADLNISRAALSQRLDTLVSEGLLRRVPYREGKSRVRHEYHLTIKGGDLALVLVALMQWGDRHLRDDQPPLKIIDGTSQEPVVVAFTTLTGRIVPSADVERRVADVGHDTVI